MFESTKLHLDLEFSSGIENAYRFSANELMDATGGNFGNLVFRHALRSILKDFGELTPINWPNARQAAATNRIDYVVVSCANWLGASEEDELRSLGRAQIIESFDCQVLPFGLGTQAPSGAKNLTLGPHTIRLARALSSKCNLIGVRDTFTARVLEGVGVMNTIVTGCPSNFINLDANLGNSIIQRASNTAKAFSGWDQMRTIVSEVGASNLLGNMLGTTILKFLRNNPGFYVIQSPNVLPFLLGLERDLPAGYRIGVSDNELSALRSTLLSSVLYFSSVEAWLDFSRTCSVSFGNRVHGAMVALQAGIPSLLIGHDARTEGLAEEMAIPLVNEVEFESVIEQVPEALLSLIAKLMQGYDDRRRILAGRFLSLLRDNGLDPSEEFLRFGEIRDGPAA